MLVSAQRTCGAESLYQIKLKNDPTLVDKELEIENFTRKYIEHNAALRLASQSEIVIPVVFHVIYNKDTQNVSTLRLIEQIEVLNRDFNAMNFDIDKVPDAFKGFIGKFNVKFVLANRDPKGNVTDGIERVKTSKSVAFNYATDDMKRKATLGADAWDTKSYLNIWVCDMKDYSDPTNTLLGYATFPTSAGTFSDGVVLNYLFVGMTGAAKPFNLGRTATHELGHYFNLRHIWGDANNCTADDGVADTPKQYTYSSGEPSFPKIDNCTRVSPGIMFMNYMDYSNDAALLMFTNNQVSRMLATMSGPRASLLSSKGYVKQYDIAVNRIYDESSNYICDNSFTPSISVISKGDNIVTKFKVDFLLNNVVIQTADWTGNIDFNQSVNVVFDPVIAETGWYNIGFKVYDTNDLDVDASNDTISYSLKVGVEKRALPLEEGFESIDLTANGFSISNPDNGLTWARSTSKASSEGNYSIFMNNFDYDPRDFSNQTGVFDDIDFPFIDLSDYDQALMTFDLAACQWTASNVPDNTWDTLQVLVSVDCGQTFDIVYNKFAGELMTVPNSESFFKPNNINQWREESIDLTQYVGRENVLIKIRNISNWENNIYIDRLNINGNKVTSIKESKANNIQMYPNPSRGEVVIKLDHSGSSLKQIQWMNTLGQTIQIHSMNPISDYMQFDFTHQAKGIYIANFIFEDGTISSKKLILN